MTDALTLSSGDLHIEVWPLGARLNAVHFGDSGPLVVGSTTRDEALRTKKFNGAVVGPVANRIASGMAEIAGIRHSFERNEAGITTLHSGTDGVHARDWQVDRATDTTAVLSLALAAGDGGFPGNRHLTATYALHDHTLTVAFTGTTDAPTLMNLALHPYWSNGDKGRRDLKLYVNANEYLPVTDEKIPTGELADVSGTIFDLRTAGAPSPDIDHNFCLSPRGANDVAARLEGDRATIDIVTDAPGLQVYSGKPTGIAVEPQHWPDAPNHPQFPSILLAPGAIYRQTTTYRFAHR